MAESTKHCLMHKLKNNVFGSQKFHSQCTDVLSFLELSKSCSKSRCDSLQKGQQWSLVSVPFVEGAIPSSEDETSAPALSNTEIKQSNANLNGRRPIFS
jgi:hypothetical protein